MTLFQEVWMERYGDAYQELIEKPKVRARTLLNYHVRAKHIVRQPCEYGDCREMKTDGHHHDYEEPLSVLWLCRRHHKQLHGFLSTDRY